MKTLFLTSTLFHLLLNCSISYGQVSPDFLPIPDAWDVSSTNPVYAKSIYYDDIDTARQGFHIFLPDTIERYPLILHIHGGGFRHGSKDEIFEDESLQSAAKYFLEEGLAFATIDYRLLPPEDADYIDPVGVIKCLNDSKRALQFIRYYSDDLYVDPAKVGLVGSSAGAGTCLWLATRPDMADPESPDPILHESTTVCAAYLRSSQATYDLPKWESHVFDDYDGMGSTYTTDSMVALLGFDRYADFYGGLDSINHPLHDPALIQYREDVDMLYHMSSEDPALYIENSNEAVHPSEDLLHHSLHGLSIYESALSASLETVYAKIPEQSIDNTFEGESGIQFLTRIVTGCSLSLDTPSELLKPEYSLYPNPALDQLNLHGIMGDESYSIITLSGSVVQSGVTHNQIDISLLDSGLYILVIANEQDQTLLKFIKQ